MHSSTALPVHCYGQIYKLCFSQGKKQRGPARNGSTYRHPTQHPRIGGGQARNFGQNDDFWPFSGRSFDYKRKINIK